MAYFKHLPNILYQSPLPDKSSTGDLIEIKNIFRRSKLYDYLKQNASLFNKYVIEDGGPVGGQGGVFLRSPDVFSIRYLHNGKDHPFLNSFKHCALTGMSVNYTNAGTFASYADGTPVSIQMSLTFKELNPIYHEDYDEFSEGDNMGVGF